ncbi:ribosomal protein bL12 [Amycolatopsis sp. NPDC052450]|uniref:ribosomal protein bL12 n=1 Tax=Amycolatopsis sp. NPDC052450 TaxID=3363937 RepID=UPI0037C96B5E
MATLSAVLVDDLPAPVRSGPLAPVIQGLTVKDPGPRLTVAQATAMLAGQRSRPMPEQDEFDVVLEHAGRKKIQVIKVVYEALGLGLDLRAARDLVDAVPTTLLKQVSRRTADEAKRELEAAGGIVSLTSEAGEHVTPEPIREYTRRPRA